jgi:hypothetical protein
LQESALGRLPAVLEVDVRIVQAQDARPVRGRRAAAEHDQSADQSQQRDDQRHQAIHCPNRHGGALSQ